MTALRAFCELSPDQKRIEVHFKYDPRALAAVRAVPGRRFKEEQRDGRLLKFWTIPLDMSAAARLREEFGAGLVLGDGVKAWGRDENRRQRNLGSIKANDDASLEFVSPEQASWLRPYQRADVKMMSLVNVLNANQPGTGKTVEVIYAVQEAQLKGPHLVIAPISLHLDPWREELAEHAPGARVFYGSTPAERRAAMDRVHAESRAGTADDIWFIVNPDMVRVKRHETAPAGVRVLSKDHKGRAYVSKPEVEQLFDIEWGALVLDEFHKFGMGEDRNTLFARAAKALGDRAQRKFALSGTPMGGKPIRLWGVLNFIEPDLYPAKWRWAETWLTNAEGGPVEAGAGTGIGGLQKGREEEFNAHHARHMVRRTRKEALPGLPDKVIIDVDVEMTKSQAKAYREFTANAEINLDGGRVSSQGVLAEYARMKQFSNAKCRVDEKGDVVPTTDSGKLPVLLERLDGFGIRKDNPEPGARAIVASESARFVRLLADYLGEQGLAVRRLDGSVTGERRDAVISWYKEQAPEARTLVMTTQTGGVGLNLGMTGSIHVMDETWNPDDQEQLEDRGMRNRTTPLMVLYYRTKDSIQEYIWEITQGKALSNQQVLDLRQRVLGRARGNR